jgi:hypothetical protein
VSMAWNWFALSRRERLGGTSEVASNSDCVLDVAMLFRMDS